MNMSDLWNAIWVKTLRALGLSDKNHAPIKRNTNSNKLCCKPELEILEESSSAMVTVTR
jgi:hypothetical protein